MFDQIVVSVEVVQLIGSLLGIAALFALIQLAGFGARKLLSMIDGNAR